MTTKYQRAKQYVSNGTGGYRIKWLWQAVVTQPKVNKWLYGNVVPINKVPREVRGHYRDTLYRAARACAKVKRKKLVNSSFRFRHEQEALYERNMLNGQPRPGRPLTARPGRSPHERGIGLDIPDARLDAEFIKACRAEQLIDDVSSEKWHLTNHAALKKGA